MAFHALFLDLDRSEPVVGVSNSSIAQLPAFVQEDSLPLRITLLTGFSRISNYIKVPVSGLTLEVALGAKIGNDSVLYTQQFTWTASTDLAQPYFEAVLPMNTNEIDDLLGENPSARAWFEVKVLDGGAPRTVLSKLVTVQAAVIKNGSIIAPALPTPLSAEAATAMFLQREIPCTSSNPLVLVNTNTGYKTAIWPNDDGSLHSELLT